MSSRESQNWLYKFCKSLKKQSFYKFTHGDPQLSNCFIITFKEWMYRPCYNDLSKENHRPCCRESIFPFEETVFNQCLKLAVEVRALLGPIVPTKCFYVSLKTACT